MQLYYWMIGFKPNFHSGSTLLLLFIMWGETFLDAYEPIKPNITEFLLFW